jgi:hypothetical protein
MKMLTTQYLKSRSRLSPIQETSDEQLQQYIDEAIIRIELFLPSDVVAEPEDKKFTLAWFMLTESLVLQDNEEHKTAIARGFVSENDGAFSYTRQAIPGESTGNIEVDNILRLWLRKKQVSEPSAPNIKARIL